MQEDFSNSIWNSMICSKCRKMDKTNSNWNTFNLMYPKSWLFSTNASQGRNRQARSITDKKDARYWMDRFDLISSASRFNSTCTSSTHTERSNILVLQTKESMERWYGGGNVDKKNPYNRREAYFDELDDLRTNTHCTISWRMPLMYVRETFSYLYYSID